MGMITLNSPSRTEVTVISNYFIDQYMPEANGEFVKVYIYLVRMLSNAPVSFSLEEMADRLLCTERDIIRALKYWSKQELIFLDYDNSRTLCGISILPVKTNSENLSGHSVSAKKMPKTETESVSISETPEGSQDNFYRTSHDNSASAGILRENTPQYGNMPSESGNSVHVPDTAALTPDRIKELKQSEDIIQLLYIAEQYLGKTLTATEMQKILFFYDGLKLSADLIEYLIEYCVSRNHKSIRYIETVALAWAEAGITTVQMAKDAGSRFGKDYFTILKALGINNRNPVDSEVALMDKWLKDYDFSMDIIQEACSRTIMQTGQPSFQYADKILSGWKKKNVRTEDDIKVLDAEHKKRKLSRETAAKPAQSSTPNRFNNFQQREYNFDEYEKRLLNQS
ncbi:DnaD domain protein [Blautia sp. HCP3S3_G3]|uniref:DnaD domain protein n=1 Tax=Blautia sp. HCP3S3_G3 TaxID=3438913 RepID=UPI003F8C9EE6